jgi:vacuolar protein sorting-associated protein VTA1
LREGRRPLPGPAVPEVAMGDGPGAADILVAPNLTPPQSPGLLHSMPTPSEHPSPPVFIHHIPSPTGVSDALEPQTPPQSAHLGVWGNIDTPGTWSTVATPGTARPESDADNWPSREEWMDSPTPDRFAAQEVAELSPTDRSPSTYGAERITRSSSISPRSSAVPYPVSPGIQPGEIPPESVSPRAWDMKGASTHAPPHLQFATAQPMDAPVDLTPDVIAKAQKHARFAISCLDYDDLEQARTELRTALAILGGR